MKVVKNMFLLLMAGLTTFSFTACSDDEEPAKPEPPKATIALKSTAPVVTFVSKGTFELTVHIENNTAEPTAADFTFNSMSEGADNIFMARWDQTEPETAMDTEPAKMNVTAVRKGAAEGDYILTVSYDASGNMTSYLGDTSIYYGQYAQTAQTFRFSCQAYAQQAVGLPLVTAKKGDELKIDVKAGYDQLGIDPKEVHMKTGRHCAYGGLEGDTDLELRNEYCWADHDDVFISLGYLSDLTTPVIIILGADNLETGVTHFVQLIISKGKGQYAAIHVPVQVTE